MNLFVIAWNYPKADPASVMAEMQRMNQIYPQLDADTLVCESDPTQHWLVASLQTGKQAAAPRQYLSRTASHLTLFDGLPVHPHNAFEAHRADELDRHWDQLTDVLEGKYVAARVSLENPAELEIVTDPLGVAQLYYVKGHGHGWLLSNNVHLIQRISKIETPDPLGLSMYMTIGWTLGDRTLVKDICVVPGGQRWKWIQGKPEPRRHSYFGPSDLAKPATALTPDKVQKLAQDLVPMLQTISTNFGPVVCLLSGGCDSRLVATLAITAEMPMHFRTSGDPSGSDATIASLIAKKLGRPHEIEIITTDELAEKWQVAAKRLVDQNDGLVGLWQIADVLHQPQTIDKLRIELWGTGAELGGNYKRIRSLPRLILHHHPSAMRALFVARFIDDHQALVTVEATQAAKAYLDEFIDMCLGTGFSSVSIPDVFHAYERVRRWGGSNNRKLAPVGDLLPPLCSRLYLQAAFGLPVAERFLESLQYRLMSLLCPDLHALPFAARPWLPQTLPAYTWWEAQGDWRRVKRGLSRRLSRLAGSQGISAASESASKVKPSFDQASLLETQREPLRDYCLSYPTSDIWRLVNRSLFERVMSAEAGPAARQSRLGGLYQVITLFYYFHPAN